MLEHDKPITSNGYPIIEMDKMYPDDPTDGLFRILVKRPPEMCAFPDAPFVVAVKDVDFVVLKLENFLSQFSSNKEIKT